MPHQSRKYDSFIPISCYYSIVFSIFDKFLLISVLKPYFLEAIIFTFITLSDKLYSLFDYFL
jgi:hypothetical protein